VTRRLSFSPRATTDLNDIWDYTEEHWGREQAHEYVALLVARCRALLTGRAVAKPIELANGTFLRVRSGSHAAFLIDSADGLRLVRVLHLKQDVEAELG
jgi:toxin ParE1/3/4